MLTALGIACMLWLPQPACPATGGCETGGFPITLCNQGSGRGWNLFHYGDHRSLLFTECVCPLGSIAPGGDLYASQMGRGVPVPISIPVQPANPPTGPAAPAPW
jgi:hypothetical protein